MRCSSGWIGIDTGFFSLLLRDVDHSAAHVLPAHARRVGEPLAGVEVQGKRQARQAPDRPPCLESGDLIFIPSVNWLGLVLGRQDVGRRVFAKQLGPEAVARERAQCGQQHLCAGGRRLRLLVDDCRHVARQELTDTSLAVDRPEIAFKARTYRAPGVDGETCELSRSVERRQCCIDAAGLEALGTG
jgi:hypothetical protein